MPLGAGIKQRFKQAKSKFKAVFKSKGGSDKDSSKPSTPSSTPPYRSSFAFPGQFNSSGTSVPDPPRLARAATSSSVIPPPGGAAGADNQIQRPPQPTKADKESHLGTTNPGPSTPEITSQAVSTNRAVSTERATSQPQVSECINTNVTPGHIESSTAEYAGRSVSPQNHHGILGEGSSERGLKPLATGIAQSATDALKFGPLRSIFDMLQAFAEMYILEGMVKKEYESLWQWLEALLKVLDEHASAVTSPIMASKIQEARDFIAGELNSIGEKQSGKQHGRFLIAKHEEDRFLACYRRIQEYMGCLSLDTSLSATASVSKFEAEQIKNHLATSLLISKAEEHSKDHMSSWVSRLPSSPSAWYDSNAGTELKRRGCTPGTRVDVLANLLDWVGNNSEGGVYWLNGMAGTGKTTIAYSVCKELAGEGKLAASFFCSRLRGECRDVNLIIPSIAYQLAQRSPSFQSALSAIIKNDPDVHHRELNAQFKALIEEPLLSAQPRAPQGLVVVVDALDECENKESTRSILDVLSNLKDLSIKFIVSSRPEPEIRDRMSERARSRLVLHELDRGKVPSDAQIAALVQKAGILFIYAATAVRYIGFDNFQRNPITRLGAILKGPRGQSTKENKEIDQLYTTILEAALGDEELEEAERIDMQQVLNTVVCAREPLTVNGLSRLLQINDVSRVRAALRPMWSVLHVVETSELVTTLHAPFPDFMFNPTRSKAFYCDSNVHNLKLGERCFHYIAENRPQFNICGLESSYLLDEQVPNMEKRVSEAIPLELLYACRYWADHVEAGNGASSVADQLRIFLSTHLLLWMEVLNLNKQMQTGAECMKMMVQWCDQFEAQGELVELAHDAERFVEAFVSNPVSRSTPHIYVSMLTLWPKSTPITKYYAKYTHGSVKAEGTALNRRQLAHLATWAFDQPIVKMTVSPVGQYVALAPSDHVIVVDPSSGRAVFGPFTYHGMTVRSITFSPDGTRVFAGFVDGNDATILGWDTQSDTHDIILGPLQLKGNTDKITCLSFSFDCARIATGSNDKTVRVWHAENGNLLHCLKTKDMVWDTTFSPDGTQVAAGCKKALKIWDSQTGDTILGPITTPVPVHRLSLSPDKCRIIYASNVSSDQTLYVLDAQSGGRLLGPIKGHTNDIWCIGCSPDGRYIASGSNDRTVRLWDAQNGNLVLSPLEAHTDEITSVAFSPDGSRIISGCKDGLVCTWDARQHNPTSSSGNALFDQITCAKFFPNGTRFVSGSEDGTICIWDTHTGELTVGPIKAHTKKIYAVDLLNDFIVSGSEDGNICVCNASTGEVLLGPLDVLPGRRIRAIAYSPNGKHIATGSYDEIDLWGAQTGSRVLGPLAGLQDSVLSIQFSPDGTRIVGGYIRNIVVWDVSDGKSLFETLEGHMTQP
ncbi:unnamed protein product [Rhizoctonia solani]|uniref:Nephrocystin 3-like N-terminal domain-containing protein n=1 Tax=Rhizoctonia solani TaxID=456999 RepID=A0A8H3H3U6_9AGAM|nr:unnamed protein product [Rhizoctonia solani]